MKRKIIPILSFEDNFLPTRQGHHPPQGDIHRRHHSHRESSHPLIPPYPKSRVRTVRLDGKWAIAEVMKKGRQLVEAADMNITPIKGIL